MDADDDEPQVAVFRGPRAPKTNGEENAGLKTELAIAYGQQRCAGALLRRTGPRRRYSKKMIGGSY
jgi:hypothetical protein